MTRSWIAGSCGAEMIASRALSERVGSRVDLVDLSDGRSVVLRRVPPHPDVTGHDPASEIANEAVALALVAGQAWAPRLIAADPGGAHCGVAASLQTVVRGRLEVRPTASWLDPLAAAIRAVAGMTVDTTRLPRFDPWLALGRLPPPWASNPGDWLRAVDVLRGWAPDGAGLVHRDLHPGNVLVLDGRLSGIVDWVHARRGPVEADISRCRVEVAVLAGPGASDDLLRRCADVVGGYDHRWDLLVAAELAPWAPALLGFNAHGAGLDLPTVQRRLDHVVATALQRLAA